MTCSFYGVYSTMKWPKLYVTISFVLDAKLEKASLAFGVFALVCSCRAHRVCSQYCQLPLENVYMPNECTKVERWKALPAVSL